MGGFSKRVLGIALLATATALTTVVAPPAARAVGPFSTFTMTGDVGDWITGGATYSYTSADTNFGANGGGNHIQLSAIQPGYTHYWYLEFKAPDQSPLTEGTYTNAEREAFASPGHPGMDVGGDHRGCNTITGSFTVNKLQYTNSGSLELVDVTFEQHCEGLAPAARGNFHWEAGSHPLADTRIELDTPSTAKRGTSVAVTGRLLTIYAGAPIAGRQVLITRTNHDGSRSYAVVTDANGNFALNDVPTTSGGFLYTADFAGDADYAPATIRRGMYVDYDTTTLTISLDQQAYTSGDTALITVHLGATHRNRFVAIYWRPTNTGAGDPGRLLGKVKADDYGVATIARHLLFSSVLTAVYDGDDSYAPQQATTDIVVASRLRISMRGYIRSDSHGYLYGHASPRYRIGVYPKRQSNCVGVEVDRLVAKHWVLDQSQKCLVLGADSTTWGVHSGQHPQGAVYRLRATTPGTDFAGAGRSEWVYYRYK